MKNKKGAPESAPETETGAKVNNYSETGKDLLKVLDYFRYTTGTTLDCAMSVKVLRNSVTWYVAELENLNLLQAVCVKRDRTTGRKAKHYSSNRDLWANNCTKELSLFEERDLS